MLLLGIYKYCIQDLTVININFIVHRSKPLDDCSGPGRRAAVGKSQSPSTGYDLLLHYDHVLIRYGHKAKFGLAGLFGNAVQEV